MAKASLFAKAATKSAAEQKAAKPKGTVIELPVELDGDGVLEGDSKRLNEAVTEFHAAKSSESAAVNRRKKATGTLSGWVAKKWAELYANVGTSPATPVVIANHLGESLTYVVVDKSQQYKLSDEAVTLLVELVGADAAAKMIEQQTAFSFNPGVMRLPVIVDGKPVLMRDEEGGPERVRSIGDVVTEVVEAALLGSEELDEESLADLIKAEVVTRVKPGILPRVAEFVGADAAKIGQVFEALGTSVSRYLKT